MSSAVSKVAQIAVGAVIGFVQGGPWGAVAGAALAFYVSSQQDKLDTGSLRASEPSSQTLRSSKAAARYVLGRVSTGGVLAWGQEQAGDQADGEWLHMVYVLSEGEIDGLEDIFLGEEVISAYGGNASYELVTNPTQVNTFLKANSPDWRDTQIGRGLSFVRVSFKYSAEKYPSGIPDVRFVIRGRRDIYDPRIGATGYSENTALHILWFLRNRCGVPDDEIVFASFANSASVCDEMVANPDGSTAPRYRSGCVIGADESRTQVMQKLEAACGGKLIRVGGRWMLQVGAYYGPYDFEITEDMVTGTVTGSSEPSNDSALNTVRGTFIDPSQAWAETDYPEVSISEWVIADGGEAAETLSFSYVSDPYQAQRLANIELRRRRAGGTLSIPMNFAGYNCRPGRSVKVNLPSLNMVGEFIVTDWSMSADSGCTVSVSQNEPAIFDDAVGQPYNPIGFISLPTGGLGSPTGLTWSTQDNAEVVQGTLSWLAPNGVVTGYAITVRQGATAVQAQQVPATTLQLPLSGLPSGSYTMSVAAVGPLTRSGEASIAVGIDGPPIPESCVVQATIDTITLIPGNALHGLNGGTYEYFFSTNPQATQGEYLGQGLTLTHTGLAFATNYAYFVRSKNAYGVSAFLKVVASTSTSVDNMLDALKDKIDNGQLAPALREEIALISGPPDLPGSVNSRLEELDEQVIEITDQLGEAVTQVQSNLDTATQQAQQAIDQVAEAARQVQQDLDEATQDLQGQIDGVSQIAKALPYNADKTYTSGQTVLGTDGKLYQASKAVPKNTAPPNTSYWTDVGQVVQSANGLAARVQTVETKVTNLEGTTTSQATQLTGLQSSLTTTNQNVTAAQQAAQDAAALAGGKGKVIVQAAAPAVADRLAQNLWIDTTSNANTPKRWSGSAWVAVTDKVATDAAAAAANALTVAQTKADASVVNNLSTRVTDAEGVITSQGQAMTGLQNSLVTTNQNVSAAQQAAQDASTLAGGKGKVIVQSAAPSAADRLAQNLWIDTTGNANTPKRWSGSAWVAVTDKVATDAAAAAANALSVAQTKADASAVDSLSTTVTQQGNTITSQGQALTGLNNSLTTTNQNVTAAQQAAQSASDVAGGKGKVLYQTAAPAVADRLTQNLWIDTTGGANTPKRWSGTAWVAVTDKVATDAAAAAANALNQVATKADASAVSQLSNTVTQQGQTITAQGQAITGVQSSLTTTNQNVTAAQQAAQDAATLAGGKGKVILQSAAPAVADRLAQNLWIDTTGNANTPKRWSGSAWVAVTDKVATDAATAAASALSQVATKADASAVSNLTNRVTETEGALSAQGQAITGVQASLTNTNQNVTTAQQAAQAAADLAGGKGKVMYQTAAPSVADRLAQNLWIDTTGGANTPKRWSGSAWVAVTDKVATDAAAAAANALALVQTKADASAVSNLDSRVGSAEGKVEAQGTALTNVQAAVGTIAGNGSNLMPAEYSMFASPTAPAYTYGTSVATAVLDTQGLGGYVLKTTSTNTTASATIYAVDGTDVYENYRIPAQRGKYILSFYAKAEVDGHQVSCFLRAKDNAGGTANVATVVHTLTTEWARYSILVNHDTATYTNKDRMTLGIQFNRSGVAGRAVYWDKFMVEPMIGSSEQPSTFMVGGSYLQTNALASAVNRLDARVVQTETGLTSQGAALTGLQNSLTTTNQNVTAAQQAAQSASDLAGGKGKVLFQATAPAVGDRAAQNLWIDTTGNANTPKRWNGTTWVAVTDKVATDAAVAAANAMTQVATKADASTVQQLSNTVSQQGQALSAQGQSLTSIKATVDGIGGSGNNLLDSAYSWLTSVALPPLANYSLSSAGVAIPDAASGFGYRLTYSGTVTNSRTIFGTTATIPLQLTAGKYIISFYASANQDAQVQPGLCDAGASNVVNGSVLAVGAGRVRLSTVVTVMADRTAYVILYINRGGTAGLVLTVDSLMVERQLAEGTAPASFVAGPSAVASALNAAAATSLDGRVTQNESGLASQGTAVTNLTNSLSTTNQNVTAAQQAAQAASDLAGGKGKVIIQSATPATADRSAVNLWIDTTGNANTPKRWSGSAWVAVTDKVATDAATAAASALSQVAAKADASTVQALSNTVTQQGTTITAQGSEITNIKASVGVVSVENLLFNPTFADGPVFSGSPGFSVLSRNDASVPAGAPSPRVVKWPVATTTGNNYLGFLSALNVRPPENAVTSQISVAGGEVYDFELYAYSSVARQHGLWIQFYDLDGTSVGHNWVVAAGDGVRLTNVAQTWTKLTGQATVPAGCVRMSMTFRVSVGEATDVFLSSPIARKRAGQDNAQASALQSVDARVSVTEGAISSQGAAITKLNNDVAGKADNSALQSLQSTVTQQGNTLSSQGQAVTQLQSSVGAIGGGGANLIPAEYCSFTETLPAIQRRTTTTVIAEAFSAAYGTHRLKISDSTTDGNGYFCLYANNEMLNLRLKPSTKYIFSVWAQSGVGARTVRLRHRYVNAGGSQVEAHLANLTLPAEWGRISASFTTPAALVDRAELLIFTTPVAGSQDSWWDGFMLEEQIGASVTPSSFAPGTSTYQAAGQATAISQLNTTVNQQGTAITAQASRLDGLYVQVNPEMEGDSTGLAGAAGGLVGVWTEQSARIEDGVAMGKRVDTVQSQVGDVSASVQQVSETIAGVDGKVSAMTTIKAETLSGGRRVMAGLALGSDGETAEILAYAQRFAIVDESSGQMTLPFVVSDGQVFINQAVINQAFIQNLVLGMTLRSQAVNSQGLPLIEINLVTGAFTVRGQDGNGSTLLNNGGLYVYDANGIERTAVGRLS